MSEAGDRLVDLRTTKQNWSHDHPLGLTEEQKNGSEQVGCFICEEPIKGSSYYCCTDCKFYLHKICADLPLQIHHPFYHRHPLHLIKKSQQILGYTFCIICWDQSEIYYYCSSCDFAVDVKCALLPQFIAGDFSKLHHISHVHPLIFTAKKKGIVKICPCDACEESTPGPIYSCADCEFYIHKKCAELPPKITHPSHRKHPLFLLKNAPPHEVMCSCHLCKNHIKGFIYHCSLCEFDLKIKHIVSSQIETGSHDHPFNRVSKPISFICDACGTGGDCIPYICNTCNLIVHKDCISLPKVIKISRHVHPISHIYFLPNECEKTWDCKICYNELKVEYGSCYCSYCNYMVHVNCVLNREWLEAIIEDQTQNDTLILIPKNSTTSAEDVTAIEIKPFCHQHNLQFSEEMMSYTYCDGCMQAISSPLYFCKQCDFFLHKSCAKLQMKAQFWLYQYLLDLLPYNLFNCLLCKFYSSGFSYCFEDRKQGGMCLRCFALSDILEHQGHGHRLFFDFNYEGNCSACGDRMHWGHRCNNCNFALDWACMSLPQTTLQKYDKHPLTLAYHDGNDPSQYYCDICEKKRDPSYWFYSCADCNFTAHPECTLGQFPFVKRGIKFRHTDHPHSLVTVQNAYDYPLICEECDEACLDLAVQCEEPDCNYISHFKCLKIEDSDFFPIQ